MADTGVIDAARQEEFVGKVVEQISGTMTTLLGSNWRSIGLIQEFGGAGAGDIGGARVANKPERALSARMAGRNGDGRLSELRRNNKTFHSAGRTCRQCSRRRTARFLLAAYIRCCQRKPEYSTRL